MIPMYFFSENPLSLKGVLSKMMKEPTAAMRTRSQYNTLNKIHLVLSFRLGPSWNKMTFLKKYSPDTWNNVNPSKCVGLEDLKLLMMWGSSFNFCPVGIPISILKVFLLIMVSFMSFSILASNHSGSNKTSASFVCFVNRAFSNASYFDAMSFLLSLKILDSVCVRNIRSMSM